MKGKLMKPQVVCGTCRLLFGAAFYSIPQQRILDLISAETIILAAKKLLKKF